MTFDDGYRQLAHSGGAALAESLGIRPVVFALGCIADPSLGRPALLMADSHQRPHRLCSPDDLRRLVDAGWNVGCHTATHWDCGRDGPELEREVTRARDVLESALGTEVSLFAYPWGKPENACARARQVVIQSGFAAGFSTQRGRITHMPATASFLPRDVVDDWWGAPEVMGCLAGGLDSISRIAQR